MMSTRMAVVLGWACLTAGFGCATSPQPRTPAQSDWLKQRVDLDKVPPSEKDPLRNKLVELIPGQTSLLPSTEQMRASLLYALRSGGEPPGVRVGDPACKDAIGCRVDVQYETLEAFMKFEKGKFHSPGASFEKLAGPSGRTGLVYDRGRKLMVTWFLLHKHERQKVEGRDY